MLFSTKGRVATSPMVRQLEISEATWHRWRAQYGGMKANDVKRLKERGDLLFISGQAAFDPDTKSVIGNDVKTQARATLDKLDAVLAAAGTDRSNVVKMECYLRDASDFQAWNEVFKEYYPDVPPSRSTVVVGQPLGDLLIEVAVIAGILD